MKYLSPIELLALLKHLASEGSASADPDDTCTASIHVEREAMCRHLLRIKELVEGQLPLYFKRFEQPKAHILLTCKRFRETDTPRTCACDPEEHARMEDPNDPYLGAVIEGLPYGKVFFGCNNGARELMGIIERAEPGSPEGARFGAVVQAGASTSVASFLQHQKGNVNVRYGLLAHEYMRSGYEIPGINAPLDLEV